MNFLWNFSKLQPTGTAERFEALLEGRVILWSFLVPERKWPNFGKKNLQVDKVHFTCSQQSSERKTINVIFTIIISFGTFSEFFSDFGRKISQVCWNSNLSVQRKKRQKKLLNNWFFAFFGFWQEKPVSFQESFWQGCQKYFRRVQWNTYRAKFPNGSPENSRSFG